MITPLNEAIGVGDRAWQAYRALAKHFSPKRLFDSTETISLGIFNNKMTRDRALKELEGLGVVKCTMASKGNKPAQWKLTGTTLDPVLPESIA